MDREGKGEKKGGWGAREEKAWGKVREGQGRKLEKGGSRGKGGVSREGVSELVSLLPPNLQIAPSTPRLLPCHTNHPSAPRSLPCHIDHPKSARGDGGGRSLPLSASGVPADHANPA